MVKSPRKSETETFEIVGRFHILDDLAVKRVYVPILKIQKKKNTKKKKKNRVKTGKKETEWTQNRWEQA